MKSEQIISYIYNDRGAVTGVKYVESHSNDRALLNIPFEEQVWMLSARGPLTVGIWDIDTKKEKNNREAVEKYPNPACGKIYGYHKQRGDHVIHPFEVEVEKRTKALLFPAVDILYISTIFAWTHQQLEKWLPEILEQVPLVIIGGSGWDDYSAMPYKVTELPNEIKRVDHRMTYELYDIDYSIVKDVEGCHKGCGFCMAWKKEGLKEHRVIDLEDAINPKYFQRNPDGSLLIPQSDHIVLMNNNSLADPHFYETIDFLNEYKLSVHWDQANDITLVNEKNAAALASVNYRNYTGKDKALYFAFDLLEKQFKDPLTGEPRKVDMTKEVPEKVRMLVDAGIKPRHLNWYMLIGYNTTMEEDLLRVEILRSLGCEIFAMRFRDLTGKVDVDGRGRPQPLHVKPLAAWVNGHGYRSSKFENFDRWINKQRRAEGKKPFPKIQTIREKFGMTRDEAVEYLEKLKMGEANA